MEGRGTRGNGDGMIRADECGEILFKRVEIWSRRCNPIGLEGFKDEFDFSTADVGRREVESVWGHFKMVQMCKSERSSCAKVQKWIQIIPSLR